MVKINKYNKNLYKSIMENETPKYTLHYFNYHVKAEAIRMLLSHAKVPFTDRVIVHGPQWQELK